MRHYYRGTNKTEYNKEQPFFSINKNAVTEDKENLKTYYKFTNHSFLSTSLALND